MALIFHMFIVTRPYVSLFNIEIWPTLKKNPKTILFEKKRFDFAMENFLLKD